MNKKILLHRVFLDNDDKFKYYCNQAVNPTDNKSTYKDNKVTCKNCINIIKRRNKIIKEKTLK